MPSSSLEHSKYLQRGTDHAHVQETRGREISVFKCLDVPQGKTSAKKGERVMRVKSWQPCAGCLTVDAENETS